MGFCIRIKMEKIIRSLLYHYRLSHHFHCDPNNNFYSNPNSIFLDPTTPYPEVKIYTHPISSSIISSLSPLSLSSLLLSLPLLSSFTRFRLLLTTTSISNLLRYMAVMSSFILIT